MPVRRPPRVQALRQVPIKPEEKGFGGPVHRAAIDRRASSRRLAPAARDGWLGSPRAVAAGIGPAAQHRHDGAVLPRPRRRPVPAREDDDGAAGGRGTSSMPGRPGSPWPPSRRRGCSTASGCGPVLVANQVATRPAPPGWGARWRTGAPRARQLLRRQRPRGWPGSTSRGRLPRGGHAARWACWSSSVTPTGAPAPGHWQRPARWPRRWRPPARLELVGVAGYEGSIVRPTPRRRPGAARDVLRSARRPGASSCSTAGCCPSVRWSAPAARRTSTRWWTPSRASPPWRLVLRSGCYVTHDHGLYHAISPFERSHDGLHAAPGPAGLGAGAVAARTRHRRHRRRPPGRLLATARCPWCSPRGAATGTLDVSGAVPPRLFDQHLVAARRRTAASCEPGDEVELGISHPCTTFDKWRWIPVVDDDDRVVDVVRTFF